MRVLNIAKHAITHMQVALLIQLLDFVSTHIFKLVIKKI